MSDFCEKSVRSSNTSGCASIHDASLFASAGALRVQVDVVGVESYLYSARGGQKTSSSRAGPADDTRIPCEIFGGIK